MGRSLILILVCATLAGGVRADEIRLKDGSRITGSIVAFEADSFKVETSYGFAVIRKDSIAEIIPGDAKKPVASKGSPAQSAEPPRVVPVATSTPAASANETPTAPPAPAAKPTTAPLAAAALEAPRIPPTRAKPLPPPVVKEASLPIASGLAEAIAPPAPGPPGVQEFVRGNLYVNQTFGFQMFRPPGWELQQDATAAMPNAITALGTSDETTLLVIGRDGTGNNTGRAGALGRDPSRISGGNPLDAQAASTEKMLRGLYQNYRLESSLPSTVDGLPAIEERARGIADGHDWSVVALTFGRNDSIYTILGMTYADSDLIQIRENVLSRMIASLHFLPPAAR